ncbi:MAG TPA: helix-turn-helix domain-containing protein [Sumerlaeia bacterium]|nr:helix-turn-helix domain-containing protein [Sumerlaeia bacterium]
MDDRLLTIEEVADYLKVSPKTVYRMIQRKEIPCYKVANQWRFKWSVIQDWMESENFRPLEQAKAANREAS